MDEQFFPPPILFIPETRDQVNRKYFLSGPKSSYQIWFYSYQKYLVIMYNIFAKRINQILIKNKVNWDNPKNFLSFSQFIYNCSTKYVHPSDIRVLKTDNI